MTTRLFYSWLHTLVCAVRVEALRKGLYPSTASFSNLAGLGAVLGKIIETKYLLKDALK